VKTPFNLPLIKKGSDLKLSQTMEYNIKGYFAIICRVIFVHSSGFLKKKKTIHPGQSGYFPFPLPEIW